MPKSKRLGTLGFDKKGLFVSSRAFFKEIPSMENAKMSKFIRNKP